MKFAQPALMGVLATLFVAFAAVMPSPAAAQADLSRQDFRIAVDNWNQVIAAARSYLDRTDKTPVQTDEIRLGLEEVVNDATARADALRTSLEAELRKQGALGVPPAEGEAPESAEIAAQRTAITAAVALLRGQIAQADLARLAAQDADSALSKRQRARIVERIQFRGALPLDPQVIGRAAIEAFGVMDAVIASPFNWFNSLPAAEKNLNAILAPLVFVPVAIAIAVFIRRMLLQRFGRHSVAATPSYTRRIVAATAEGVANGLVPASVFVVILARVESDQSLVAGLFGVLLSAAMEQAITFVLIVALAHAALSPDRPDWRLTALKPENAAILSRRIGLLAAALAITGFLDAVVSQLITGRDLRAVLGFSSTLILSTLIILVARKSLWLRDEGGVPGADKDDDDESGLPDTGLMGVIRRLAVFLPLLASLAAAVGFVQLGTFVVGNIIQTGFIAACAYLIRDLLREVIGFAMASTLMRDRLQVPHETRRRVKFWVRAVIDPAILVVAILLILPVWGVPWIEVTAMARNAFFGFEVGQVRISVVDILAAVLVFAVAMAITRLVQRTLRDRVLPQTRLDQGVRHSVTAGIGYIGAILGGLIAVTVIGVDLSNIALIAGALSVGIGFGLQNIVNNFVSGLILLVERPIKVGDWVNVGGNEGFVRQINVRATEIETFQKASVIIPNADLLSSAVTNWTHKDRYGRIEVAVGVAYGTDTRKVERILLETAREHPLVSKVPEPFVVFMNFGASSLDFEVRCYTNDVVMKLVISSDIRHEVDRKFRAEDIEIPFPQRVLHIAPDSEDPALLRRRRPGQGQAEIDGDSGE